MKLRANKGFPYPVLSPYSDDYENCEFTANVSVEIQGYDFALNINVTLTDDELSSMLEQEKSWITLHVECPSTGYRKIFSTKEYNNRIVIPFKLLRDMVEINTFIVAAEDIDDFSSSNFNSDYGNDSFKLEKGCIMAVSKEVDARIPKKLTDLMEKEDPFVTIVPIKDKNEKNISINLDEEKILIMVPENTASSYKALQETQNMRPILTSIFIVPAITQGLIYLKGLNAVDLSEAESRLWVQSLKEILKERFKLTIADIQNKEMNELFVLAQQLVDNPMSTGVDNLIKWHGGQTDEDED